MLHPYQPVLAALIGTDATLHSTRAQQACDDINSLLLREDVQNALMAQGIDPLEAKVRIDSLSDAEVIRIANEIDKLPAGGGVPGVLIEAGIKNKNRNFGYPVQWLGDIFRY